MIHEKFDRLLLLTETFCVGRARGVALTNQIGEIGPANTYVTIWRYLNTSIHHIDYL